MRRLLVAIRRARKNSEAYPYSIRLLLVYLRAPKRLGKIASSKVDGRELSGVTGRRGASRDAAGQFNEL